MAGNEQFVYPIKDLGGAGRFGGDYLATPDGTQLVLATENLGNKISPRTDQSLVVMGNDGSIVRTLPAPMPEGRVHPGEVVDPRRDPHALRGAAEESSCGRSRSTAVSPPR